MSIREDFEAWAGPKGYPLRTIETGERISYSYGPTLSAFAGYQAATSRQATKIKALVDAAELVIAWYEAEDDHAKEPDFYKRIEMCRASEDALRSAIALVKETP